MYLLDLVERPWGQSMLIFHTLARMGIEAVDIVWSQMLGVKTKDFTKAILEANKA